LSYCSLAKKARTFSLHVIPGFPWSFRLGKVGIRWYTIGTRIVGISRDNLKIEKSYNNLGQDGIFWDMMGKIGTCP
jgi:hypothetical protein